MDAKSMARQHLTEFLSRDGAVSYLRLGDGELIYLVDGKPNRTGLYPCHYQRLISAYQECSYLDLCMNGAYNRENIAKLDLNVSAHTYINSSPATGNLIRRWTYYDFRYYILERRCLIAGPEASLLRELYADPKYRALAWCWPEESCVYFLQARENGTNLDRNVDLIKEDIIETCEKHSLDTVFLSLGGGAKILCHEIAQELEITTIDWGSLARALAYSASAGHSLTDAYCPYFFRIPFDMYMRALEAAHPEFGTEALLAKAHAQLRLEVNRRNPMAGAKVFDPSPENLRDFYESLAIYKKRWRPRAWRDVKALRSVLDFEIWRAMNGCGYNGAAGRLFLAVVRSMMVGRKLAKKYLRKGKKLFM